MRDFAAVDADGNYRGDGLENSKGLAKKAVGRASYFTSRWLI